MRWKKLSAEEELGLATEIRKIERSLTRSLQQFPVAVEILNSRGPRVERTSCQAVDRIEQAVAAVGAMRPRPTSFLELRRDWLRSDELRWRLAMSGYRIAHGEANKLASRGVSNEDLVNEGIIGLYDAAKRYDPRRKLRFSTYARWWVRAKMIRAIDTTGTTIRLPGGLLERVRRIEGLRSRHDDETISEMTGESLSDIARITAISDSVQAISFSIPVVDGTSSKPRMLEDVVADSSAPDPEQVSVQNQQRDSIRAAVAQLKPQQRQVVSIYLGFETGIPTTLEEAASTVGISRERVRQLVRRVADIVSQDQGTEGDDEEPGRQREPER